MHIQNRIVLGVAIALAIASAASAQRRGMPAMADEVSVAIELQVAGQPYHFEGKAECEHEPSAYIYSVRAELWSVQQIDGQRSVLLSLWRPQHTSGEMFSLNVGTRGKSYLVNTIKPGGAVKGSGKMTVTRSGAGGTFTINATAADGAPITGTIKCSGFTAAVAEGG
jgi:hypothetical protein